MSRTPESRRSTELFIGLGCGAAAFANYLSTLGPTVGPGDAGELTLAALGLGICHPPGYPLFTWLGRIACLLPVSEPALATNGLTAFIAAVAVGALFLAGRRLGLSLQGAVVAALSFGFGPAFWLAATSHEVYALTILLLALLLLSSSTPCSELTTLHSDFSLRPLLVASFLLGLALAHQPTALLWLPALAVLAWPRVRSIGPRPLLILVGLALLGFSSGLGTLFRALARPEVNWGDPSTLGRFLGHITAAQYRGLSFSTPGPEFWTRVRGLLFDADHGLGHAATRVAVLGLGALVFTNRRALAGLLLLLGTALFALGYWIPDYRVHLLPSFVAVALLSGAGATWFESRVATLPALLGRRPGPVWLVPIQALCALLLLAIPGHQLFLYRRAASENRTTMVRDLGTNLLLSLPDSAVLLYGGDVPGNTIRYVQTVAHTRTDVRTVAVSRLLAADYYAGLRSIADLPDWTATLTRTTDPSHIGKLRAVFDAAAPALMRRAPVCLTVEIVTDVFFASRLLQTCEAVPSGIVYRLVPRSPPADPDSVLLAGNRLWDRFRGVPAGLRLQSPDYANVQFQYAAGRNNLGMYLFEHGRAQAAVENLDLAYALTPDSVFHDLVRQNLARVAAPERGGPAVVPAGPGPRPGGN